MKAPFAFSAAAPVGPGLPEKFCKNVFPEPYPNDPTRPMILVETPGSLQQNTFAGQIRGMGQADGFANGQVLIVAGQTVYRHTPGSGVFTAMTGTVAGTDTVQFAWTEDEMAILGNGVIHVSSDGLTIAAVTDPSFATLLADAGATAFTSIATLGQRLLFTYGPRFGFSDVLDIGTTDALSYYTAESSPDALIAVFVVGELAYLFGTQTIEAWAQTGDSDDPYALQPGMTQQVGCLSRDSIRRADNTLFYIDNACNARRLGQGASEIISKPWMSDKIRAAGAANIHGLFYEDRGHIFVGWRMPECCFLHDVLTGEPHTRETNLETTWRYSFLVTAGTQVFAADADGQFDLLSRTYTSESMPDADTMGTEIVREMTAFLDAPSRMDVSSVRFESAKGIGTSTGQGVNPVVMMEYSIDGGNTWSASVAAPLGPQGVYDQPTIYRRCGRVGRQGMLFRFRKSDPVSGAYLGVRINEDLAA